ncbi:MAG: trigger factor [Acidimicrobiaceae bacterium]|nr:trigger factor [Acidimicrobiaceae bacterium]MYJ42839.1 trigger factor [Acidimicrobiaceae bacterium]
MLRTSGLDGDGARVVPRDRTGTLAAVRSSVETLTDNRVKLTVELDEAEFETEVEAAFRRIAHEVRIPGFRPGRAPRRLLEAQLGPAAGRAEALRASLPDYYARAVVEHDVDVIDAPRIEVTEGAEAGPVSFDAVVDVRPAILVSGYDELSVQIPSPAVDEEEIEAEIDRFRRQFAELAPVKRAAVDGDHLTIDITGALGGETIDGLTTSDYDYLLGTGAVVPEIDENLRGSSAGDILEFLASHPDPDEDQKLRFRVLVKEVQEAVLPDFDDEFVGANTEFDTAEEFRGALEAGQARTRVMYAESVRREAVAAAVAGLVTDEVPEAMIASEVDARRENLTRDLAQRGYELDDYLDSIGQSRDEFEGGLRLSADRSVKLDLALRAVAVAEGLEADDEAVDAELEQAVVAAGNGAEVDAAAETARLRDALASSGRLSDMRSQISKRTAMEWITERVELVDPDGEVVDPELLTLPADVGEGAASPQDVDADPSQDEQTQDEQPQDVS